MDPLKDKYGCLYYEKLPPGWRVAKESDFHPIWKAFKEKMPFLLFGNHSKVFEFYQVRDSFTVDKIRWWLDRGDIYVKEN